MAKHGKSKKHKGGKGKHAASRAGGRTRSAGRANSGGLRTKSGGQSKKNLVVGTLRKTRRGYGFVVPEDGSPDIFVAGRDLKGAMNGDVVRVATHKDRGKGPAGEVTKILKRGRGLFVGRVELMEGGFAFVVPIDPKEGEDIFVDEDSLNGAKDGDYVQVALTRRPEAGYGAEGTVQKILATADDPHGAILALLLQRAVPTDFSPKAVATAEALQRQGVPAKDYAGRRDLRQEKIFTIDGADSKDFDDAVSCRELPNGNYELGVHIADVSQYVREGDPLDTDAYERANSHYLLDLVVPMLPHELSDDLCSLVPGQDRLTLSCVVEVSPQGRPVRYEVFESVICSCHRLVYGDISDLLEAAGNENPGEKVENLRQKYADILPDLMRMGELARILEASAHRRGSLDFELPEAAFTMDETGHIQDVHLHERRSANRRIEDFMVLANETVARHFANTKTPFVYRVHEKPERDKLEQFLNFAATMGLDPDIQLNDVSPVKLQEIIAASEGLATGPMIRRMMLRSMQKACYEATCKGHFGLALAYYCHFTSPIRRYADLFIHREIKRALHGKTAGTGGASCTIGPDGVPMLSGTISEDMNEVDGNTAHARNDKTTDTSNGINTEADDRAAKVGEHISAVERSSIELERDVDKMAMAIYMQDHVGEVFEGTISGFSGRVVFVELDNLVEGGVRLETLEDDYYVHDEEHYCIVGEEFGRRYTLGDRVTVRVAAADPAVWSVDFKLLT